MRCSSGNGRVALLALLAGLSAGSLSCNGIFGIEPGELTGSSTTAGTGAAGGTGGASTTGGTSTTTGGSGGASTSSSTGTMGGTGGGGPCAAFPGPDGQTTGWVKPAIGSYSERGLAIARPPAGGLIVAGIYGDDDFVVDLAKLPYGTYADEPGDRDNVFVAHYKPDGKPDWATGFAGRDTQRVVSLATDAAGSSIVGGYFLNSFTVGSTTLTSDGQLLPEALDGFVFKLGPTGTPLWAKQLGGPSVDAVRGVATDSSGNVFVLGASVLGGDIATPPESTSVQYGCEPRVLEKDVQTVFLTKLSPQGDCLWDKALEIDTRFYGIYSEPVGLALTVDPDDNVILVGGFAGVVNFGGGTSIVAAGGKDIFVVKADPAGEPIWAAAFGDDNFQAATAVATDQKGDIWIGGACQHSVTLDPLPVAADPLADPNYSKGFIAKLELDPNPTLPAKPVFLQPLWDGGWQELRSVATDAAGDVVFGGNAYAFAGATGIDFGDGQKIAPSGMDQNGNYYNDGFVAKYCSNGGLRWSRRFGTSASETVFGVAADDAGNTFVTGSFEGKYDFGGSQSYTPLGEDVFTLRLGP